MLGTFNVIGRSYIIILFINQVILGKLKSPTRITTELEWVFEICLNVSKNFLKTSKLVCGRK